MTKSIIYPFSTFLILVLHAVVLANSPPEVNNVTASQRTDGSELVDIYYDLADANGDSCTIWVNVSNDGGSIWDVPAATFSGDIGSGITPGANKHIIWDSAADLPGAYGTNYRVRVYADDSNAPIPPDMVIIPAGEFDMGDHHGDGYSDELPIHTVTLDSFYIGKYEITNGQYCQYLNSALGSSIYVSGGIVYGSGNNQRYCDTHSYDADSQIDYNDISETFSVMTKGGRDISNDPMVEISWYGSVAYCNWRSQQEGKEQCYNLSTWACDFNKHGYRLATEAEWEYAARGGLSGKRFPWGDTITHSQANYYSSSSYSYDISPTRGDHPLWNDGIYPYTSPVDFFDGTLKYKTDYNWPGSATSYQTTSGSNGYGLYDMAGNILEWCNDWYGGYSSNPQTNPTGPTSGYYRVLRGGAWLDYAFFCRVAYRYYCGPNARSYYLGFRVILDLDSYTTWADSGLFTIANRDIWYIDNDAPNDPEPNNPNVSDPNEDGSPEHPFDAIQEAIDVSYDGDTVIVLPGTYTGTGNRDIDYQGKAITVRSIDPNDPNVIAATVIDCQQAGRGFYFHSGEDEDSLLEGFAITNGHIGYGAGVFCIDSGPTLTNLIIRECSAQYGGGMACERSSPKVSHLILIENLASTGGGGGLSICHNSSPNITDITIVNNNGIWGGGIRIYGSSSPIICNALIARNEADLGGGVLSGDWSYPEFYNVTIVDNTANYGGGFYCRTGTMPSLVNAIVQNVAPQEIYFLDSLTPSSISIIYSDLQGGEDNIETNNNGTVNWGDGNIDADPCFADPDNDNYRLLWDSPCIDAGDPNYIPGPNETDLDGRPRAVDGNCNGIEIIDMGAYEFSYAYICDFTGDCKVDFGDLVFLTEDWLQGDSLADIYPPPPDNDDIVNFLDFAKCAENWLEDITP